MSRPDKLQEKTQTKNVCDPEVYAHGDLIVILAGPKYSKFEEWKNILQSKLPEGTKLDWSSYCGRAAFQAIGDTRTVRRVMAENFHLFETTIGLGEGGYPLVGHDGFYVPDPE